MKIQIISLFPSMFDGPLGTSMMKKAQDKGLAEISYIDLRDFGEGTRKTVDDTPYGGGDGMVLKPGPVVEAIEASKKDNPTAKVILLTPQGKTYKQIDAQRLATEESLVLVCGHYEGFDERIRSFVDEQISIGDYVLTGGEIPATVLVDSIVRLIPGVLGGENSASDESFSDGKTLEYPHYTRPDDFRGMPVPDVLKSGNHAQIAKWRADQSQKRTQ